MNATLLRTNNSINQPTIEYEVSGTNILIDDLDRYISKSWNEAKRTAQFLFANHTDISIVKSDDTEVLSIWDMQGRKLVKVE